MLNSQRRWAQYVEDYQQGVIIFRYRSDAILQRLFYWILFSKIQGLASSSPDKSKPHAQLWLSKRNTSRSALIFRLKEMYGNNF